MAAYLVVMVQIHDRNAFLEGYAVRAAELTAQFGGEYLARSSNITALEGEHPSGSMVISKWPDKAAALRLWNSPEYAEAKKLRQGLADCQVMLVED